MAVTYYTEDEYEELLKRAESAELDARVANSMRPMWAMGYSSDSVAAQASSAALMNLWELLSAKNQTEAVHNLKLLLANSQKS